MRTKIISKIPQETLEQIYELLKQGKKYEDIGNIVGLPKWKIGKIISQMDTNELRQKPFTANFCKEKVNKIITLMGWGYDVKEICLGEDIDYKDMVRILSVPQVQEKIKKYKKLLKK